MRKTFIIASALSLMLVLNGCGAGTTKKTATNDMLSGINTSELSSALTTVIGELLQDILSRHYRQMDIQRAQNSF